MQSALGRDAYKHSAGAGIACYAFVGAVLSPAACLAIQELFQAVFTLTFVGNSCLVGVTCAKLVGIKWVQPGWYQMGANLVGGCKEI